MSGFRIATIRGIPIRIHVTFLIALPFIAYGFGRAYVEAARTAHLDPQQLAVAPWLWGLGVALALFLSVLIHELGHALYALRVGGHVEEITLLMIGGVSRITEPPTQTRQEAVMALLGPLTSLVLGGSLYLLFMLFGRHTSFSFRFAWLDIAGLNLLLGVFNLLPAFPMDGGRVLRALLVRRLGILRATHAASRVGKVFAVLFGAWGILSFNLLLLLVAFFVYVGAEAEENAVAVKALLSRVRIQDVMNAQVFSLPAYLTVLEAGNRMLAGGHTFCFVTAEGRIVGLLTLDAIVGIAPEQRQRVLARDIAVRTAPVGPSEEAARAFQIMNETHTAEVAVSEDGHLVGAVSRDDIVRALKLSELQETQRQPPRWPGHN